VLRRLWNRIRGRRYFVALDPGGTFVPSAMVLGYIDRKGEVHITDIHTEENA
jgi:hypothetical protein